MGYPLDLGISSAIQLCPRPPGCRHNWGVLRVGLIGPRGSGKSSLLRCLLGKPAGAAAPQPATPGSPAQALLRVSVDDVLRADMEELLGSGRVVYAEELTAADNEFIRVSSSRSGGADGHQGYGHHAGAGAWSLAGTLWSLLSGPSGPSALQGLGMALRRRFDLVLVVFDSQSFPSAAAALELAEGCRRATEGCLPLLLVATKAGERRCSLGPGRSPWRLPLLLLDAASHGLTVLASLRRPILHPGCCERPNPGAHP